jgi:CheY-like chemotaxis protein
MPIPAGSGSRKVGSVKRVIIAEHILTAVGGADSLFGRGGIVSVTARTSEAILALHREKKADLIVSDLSLPRMGGIALIEKVRGDASLRNVSIIMACEGRAAEVDACRAAGANAIIGSPVVAADLFARMSELIVVPRRKDMRVMLRVSIEDSRGAGTPAFAMSENISISGMLLETTHPYRPGERIFCSFHVGHSEVKVEGKVVRTDRRPSGSRYRCGIQFTNIDIKTMVVIEHFVKSRMSAAPKKRR